MIVRTVDFKNMDVNVVYKNISHYLKEENLILDYSKCYSDLLKRDSLGNIKVYSDLYLPHIVSSNFLDNIIIRGQNDKDKFLFILLKDNSEENRIRGINIVRKLLVREFVDEIFLVDNREFEDIFKDI